jgi:hypothetical protein
MGEVSKIFVALCCLICCYVVVAAFFYRDFWNTIQGSQGRDISSSFLSWERYSSSEIAAFTKKWLFDQNQQLSKFSRHVVGYVNTSSFDPFSLYSGVNIWDLFPPEFSCPDLKRIGNIGDGA